MGVKPSVALPAKWFEYATFCLYMNSRVVPNAGAPYRLSASAERSWDIIMLENTP